MGMRRDQAERLEEGLRKTIQEIYWLKRMYEHFDMIDEDYMKLLDDVKEASLNKLNDILKIYNQD